MFRLEAGRANGRRLRADSPDPPQASHRPAALRGAVSRTRSAQSKRLETLSSLAMRAMASPISGAIETTRMFFETRMASVGWMVSVMNQFFQIRGGDARHGAAREHAMGDIGVTPPARRASSSASAALHRVPPESTMSSMQDADRGHRHRR